MSSAPIQVLAEAQIVQEFHLDTAMLDDAKKRYADVDATTKEGYASAIEGRALFRDTRIAIDKRRKELKADALAYGKRVDSVAKQLTELVSPTEDELDAKIKKVDQAKADAKQAELRAKEEAERERLRAEQESERQRLAAEREDIEKEKAALAQLKAQQEAEAQARREQEERDRQAREEAERKRIEEHARRMTLLRRLDATGAPGCLLEDTCTMGADTGETYAGPNEEFRAMPLDRLESLVATKELAAKEQREARARLEQEQREQQAADERRAAEERAAEEQRLAQQRADIEAREAAIAAKEKAEREAAEEQARKERERRASLVARLTAVSEAHCKAYDTLPLDELEALTIDQEAKAKRAREAQEAREAEERAVAEQERQAALAKRREALKPDSEKLRIYAQSIRTVSIPEFSDDAEVTLTVNTTIDALNAMADSLDRCADMLVGKRTPNESPIHGVD